MGPVPSSKFKPVLTYIHLKIKRTQVVVFITFNLTKKENQVKQTLPYVKYVFDLFLEHGLFDSHSKIKLWSDGCGKHFKAYGTQAFMCHFQERLQSRLSESWVITKHFLFINFRPSHGTFLPH